MVSWMLGSAIVGGLGRGKGGEKRVCTDHYEPFRLLDAVRVWLWISQRFPFSVFGRFDLVGGAVADEDGLAAPFDDNLFHGAEAISTMALQRSQPGKMEEHTFLPSGMAARSISTFACASTSAEAAMLTRKSAFEHHCKPLRLPNYPTHSMTLSKTLFIRIVIAHLAR